MERCTKLRGECHDPRCYTDTPHECHDMACRTGPLTKRVTDAQVTIAALRGQVREYREQIELLQGMLVSYRREADTLGTQLANTAEGTDERRT